MSAFLLKQFGQFSRKLFQFIPILDEILSEYYINVALKLFRKNAYYSQSFVERDGVCKNDNVIYVFFKASFRRIKIKMMIIFHFEFLLMYYSRHIFSLVCFWRMVKRNALIFNLFLLIIVIKSRDRDLDLWVALHDLVFNTTFWRTIIF